METSFSLRPLSLDDPEELQRLVRIDQKIQKYPWKASQFLEETRVGGAILVLTDDETDEKIAGYVVYRVYSETQEVELLQLGVALEYRGLGYGLKLGRQVVQVGLDSQCTRILLNVRTDNKSAIEMYQKLKFVITGTRKGFYSDGDSAYQMELNLSGSGIATVDSF